MGITYLDEPADPSAGKITYLDTRTEEEKLGADIRDPNKTQEQKIKLIQEFSDKKLKSPTFPLDLALGKVPGERALPPDQTAENQNPENRDIPASEVVKSMQDSGMIPKQQKRPAIAQPGDNSDLVGFVPFHNIEEAATSGFKSAKGIGDTLAPLATSILPKPLADKINPTLAKIYDTETGLLIGATNAAGTAFNPVTEGATKLESVYDVARDYIRRSASGTPIDEPTLKEYQQKIEKGFSKMFPESKPDVTESTAKNFLSDLTAGALNAKFNTALLVLGGVEGAGGGKVTFLDKPIIPKGAVPENVTPGVPARSRYQPPPEIPSQPIPVDLTEPKPPVVETKPPVTYLDKQPWEMTKAEYVQANDTGTKDFMDLNKERFAQFQAHKNAVVSALKEGKSVPQEVLNEYPDLQTEEQIPETPKPPEEAKKEIQDGVANVFRSEGAKNAKEAKDQLVQQLELAEKVAPEKHGEGHNKWVTVDVPGDGTFTIINTKENVQGLLKKAKRLQTSDIPDKGYVERGPSKADKEWLKEQLELQEKQPQSVAGVLEKPVQASEDLVKVADVERVNPDARQIPEPEQRSIEPVQGSSMGQPKPLPEGKGNRPTVSRRAIIEDISKSLDTPIRFGRVFTSGGGVSRYGGYFSPHGQIITSKFANDLIVATHEGGHKLDDTFGLWKMKNLQKELDYLGDRNRPDSRSSWTPSKPFKYKLKEGVAEFTRYWMMEPEKAREIAPETYHEFETILNSEPKLRAAFDKARDDIRVWRESDAQGRIRASVSVGEPALKSNRPSERLVNQFIDEYYTMSKVVDFANEIRGKPLEPIKDPYLLARLFKGADGTVQSFLKNGTVDFKTRSITGEGLEHILKPIAESGKIGDFRDYMIARRARELHARGKETGLSVKDVNTTFEKLSKEHPEFAESFDKLQEWNDRLLQYAVDAKLISGESKAVIQEMNKDYVPYNRVFEIGAGEAAVEGGGTGRGLNAGGKAFKGIKGSMRDIVDPLESMIKNTFHVISSADKNWVNLALADLSKEQGMARFVRRAAPKVVPNKVAISKLREQLEAMGADFTDYDKAKAELEKAGKDTSNLDDELMLTFFEQSKAPSYGENIVRVNRSGKSEYYQLDGELYRAVKSLDRDEMNMLGRFLTGFANLKRAGVTLIPDFVISNSIRDTISSAIISRYSHVPFVQTIRGLFALMGKPELVNEWAVSGGKLGIEGMYFDRTATQKFLQTMLGKRLDGSAFTLKDYAALTLKSPLELLRRMSAISELSTRIGEFEAVKKSLIKKGELPENYRRLAAFESRNLLDFSRSGAKMKAWNGMMPFFNAQLQGVVRMGEAFKRNPVGTTVKAFTWITVPTTILYSINRNDPEYWDRPQWERDIFWLFPFGKDDSGKTRFLRIPKPFEWGAAFATLPERIFQWVDKKDPKAFDQLGQRIAGAFLPVPTGNPLFSIMEVMSGDQGYSFWSGKKIIPDSQKQLPPELQYDDRTSLSAKKLGRAMKVSPKKIDYMIYGAGGGLGSQAVHYGLDSILSLMTGDETSAIKPAPGRRFVTTPAGFDSQAIENFYEKLDKLKQERARIKSGEASELSPEELSQLPGMEKLSVGLAGLRRQENSETDPQKKQEIQLLIRDLVLPFVDQPEKEGLKSRVQ